MGEGKYSKNVRSVEVSKGCYELPCRGTFITFVNGSKMAFSLVLNRQRRCSCFHQPLFNYTLWSRIFQALVCRFIMVVGESEKEVLHGLKSVIVLISTKLMR